MLKIPAHRTSEKKNRSINNGKRVPAIAAQWVALSEEWVDASSAGSTGIRSPFAARQVVFIIAPTSEADKNRFGPIFRHR